MAQGSLNVPKLSARILEPAFPEIVLSTGSAWMLKENKNNKKDR
jgi:hypothetical protein